MATLHPLMHLVPRMFNEAVGVLCGLQLDKRVLLGQVPSSSRTVDPMTQTCDFMYVEKPQMVFTLRVAHKDQFKAQFIREVLIDELAWFFGSEIRDVITALKASYTKSGYDFPNAVNITSFDEQIYWLEIPVMEPDICQAVLTLKLGISYMSEKYKGDRVMDAIRILRSRLSETGISLHADFFLPLTIWMQTYVLTGKEPELPCRLQADRLLIVPGIHYGGSLGSIPHVGVYIKGNPDIALSESTAWYLWPSF